MYSANTQAYEAYNFYVDAQRDPLPLVVSPDFQSWDCKIPIPGLGTLRSGPGIANISPIGLMGPGPPSMLRWL